MTFDEWYSQWTEDVSDKDLHKDLCEIAFNAGRESQAKRIESLRRCLVFYADESNYERTLLDRNGYLSDDGNWSWQEANVTYDNGQDARQALEADKGF